MTIKVNGKVYEGGKNVVIKNGDVYIDGQKVNPVNESSGIFSKIFSKNNSGNKIVIEGNIEHLTCDETLNVNGIVGSAQVGGSLNCDDITGNVTAGRTVNAHNIGGDVIAGRSVNASKIMGSSNK